MRVFAEGIESIKLACSLVLLIPAFGVTLLGHRRNWLVPAWIATVGLTAWFTFVGWWTPLASGPGHVLVGVALLGLAAFAWRQNTMAADLAATCTAAFLATWTWIPCVGRELGDILNNAPRQPWVEFLPTMLYTLGLFIALVLIAALEIAWPRFGDAINVAWVRTTGIAIIGLVGALVAVTLFDDVASELVKRSSF